MGGVFFLKKQKPYTRAMATDYKWLDFIMPEICFCVCIYMYVCMSVCMLICIYIYIFSKFLSLICFLSLLKKWQDENILALVSSNCCKYNWIHLAEMHLGLILRLVNK